MSKSYCSKNNCESYDCVYHYSNAPWNELINVFTPIFDKEKECTDYKKEEQEEVENEIKQC